MVISSLNVGLRMISNIRTLQIECNLHIDTPKKDTKKD